MERLFTYDTRRLTEEVTPTSSESNMRRTVLCKKLYFQKILHIQDRIRNMYSNHH